MAKKTKKSDDGLFSDLDKRYMTILCAVTLNGNTLRRILNLIAVSLHKNGGLPESDLKRIREECEFDLGVMEHMLDSVGIVMPPSVDPKPQNN